MRIAGIRRGGRESLSAVVPHADRANADRANGADRVNGSGEPCRSGELSLSFGSGAVEDSRANSDCLAVVDGHVIVQ
jgi:hypothetical protein